MRLKAAAVEDEILLQVGRVRGVVEVPRSGELWLRQRPVFWRTTTTTRARVLANYGYDKGPRSGELRLRQRPAFWRTTAMTKARVLANYGYDKGPRSGELRLRQGPAFWRTAATTRARVLANCGYWALLRYGHQAGIGGCFDVDNPCGWLRQIDK
jgi:hypothetical protein